MSTLTAHETKELQYLFKINGGDISSALSTIDYYKRQLNRASHGSLETHYAQASLDDAIEKLSNLAGGRSYKTLLAYQETVAHTLH